MCGRDDRGHVQRRVRRGVDDAGLLEVEEEVDCVQARVAVDEVEHVGEAVHRLREGPGYIRVDPLSVVRQVGPGGRCLLSRCPFLLRTLRQTMQDSALKDR